LLRRLLPAREEGHAEVFGEFDDRRFRRGEADGESGFGGCSGFASENCSLGVKLSLV
jgi:hypothetical protein